MMGSGVRLTRRLSIRPCTSSKSTVTGLNAAPPIVQDVAMCLPACALIWFLSAVKVLMAVWMLPAPMAACAAASLVGSALAMLSKHPAARRSLSRLVMLLVVDVTLACAVAEWLSDPEAPVTVREKFEGTRNDGRLTLSTEVAALPPDGVTEFGDSEAMTPAGWPVTLRLTDELNPFSGFTFAFVEPDPPALIVSGAIAPRLKSPTGRLKV